MNPVPFSGKRLAADRLRATPKLGAGAAWFLGPRAWRIHRAGRRGDRARLHRLERAWAAGVSRFLDIRLDIAGAHHIQPDGRYVVASLHEGFADAVALMHLGLDLRFVAHAELLEWPMLGRYLRASDQLLIEAHSARSGYRRIVERGRHVLDAGESLVMFPQGSILGIEIAFWPGAFALAKRLDAEVLPVVLTGSHRVWEYPYSPIVRFGQPMSMRVLPPIPGSEAQGFAGELERKMKRIALDPGMAPARRFRPEIDGYWDGYPYEIDAAFPELASLIDLHRQAASR